MKEKKLNEKVKLNEKKWNLMKINRYPRRVWQLSSYCNLDVCKIRLTKIFWKIKKNWKKIFFGKFQNYFEKSIFWLKKPNFWISEYAVVFLDPVLLDKSAIKCVLGYNLLNKSPDFPSLSRNLHAEFARRTLKLKISKFWVRSFVPRPQITRQNCHQICSTMKFAI